MNKVTNALAIILLLMAFLQAPYFYYYCFGLFSFFVVIPYLFIAGCLTFTLLIIVIRENHRHHKFQLFSLLAAVVIGSISLVLEPKIEKLDWELRKSSRAQLIMLIKSGQIPSSKSVYHLENYNFPPISNGGNDIIIERGQNNQLTVTFFTDRGFLDHYAAFVYTEDEDKIDEFSKRENSGNFHLEGNWHKVTY